MRSLPLTKHPGCTRLRSAGPGLSHLEWAGEPYFAQQWGPYLLWEQKEVVHPPVLPPRQGKVFPNTIPNPPDEKLSCTTDPLKMIGRLRVKKRAPSKGKQTTERTSPRENLPKPQQRLVLEESCSTIKFPNGQSRAPTPLSPTLAGQVTLGRANRQRP